MPGVIGKLFKTIALGIVAYLLSAFALVYSQSSLGSNGSTGTGTGLDFGKLLSEQETAAPAPRIVRARDSAELTIRFYDSVTSAANYLVLLHGSGWHGLQFNALAQRVSSSGAANVVVPDLRGHGENPLRRGDVDYVGQLEDDLADIIAHIKQDDPAATIFLGGHSSGGGLAVRFAGGDHGAMADGWILIAPFLKYNAPTTRPNSGGWAIPLTRRIIGLTMLNAVGIRFLNHLPVIHFNFPQSVLEGPVGHTATTAYSHRLNTSYAPRPDFEADLAAIDKPLLVIAGELDEAFFSDQFEPVISAQTGHGEYEIISGETHLGIVISQALAVHIIEWLKQHGN